MTQVSTRCPAGHTASRFGRRPTNNSPSSAAHFLRAAAATLLLIIAANAPSHAQNANPAAPAAAPNPPARAAQAALPPGTLLAENAFKNVQVLKGISVSEFMATMGFFSASLSESCEYCHTLDNTGWAAYASDANPHKETARKMVRMMFAINRDNFGGRRAITCFSCHNGGEQPRVTPTLALVYAGQAPDDPNEVAPVPAGAPKTPTADEIFDKYIQAIGGAQSVAALTSIVAKGSSVGYADENYKRPIDIFAKSPDERTQVIHTLTGDNTTVYNGREGWSAAPGTAVPVPLLPLLGADIENAKLDAELLFPSGIKQILKNWRVGSATIDDKPVQFVVGTNAVGLPARLYFDAQTGLLVRQVRFIDSPVGRNTTQIDYSDYRDVAGVKMPFHWAISWLDGTATFDLDEVHANVPIDAAKFGKPAAPAAASAAAK